LNVATDLSFVTLIMQASVVVQGILLLLAAASLWSWWQIFLKLFQLKRTSRDTDAFENEFWKGGDLNELYQSSSKSRTGSGLEHIFTAGFREYAKHRKQGSTAGVTTGAARSPVGYWACRLRRNAVVMSRKLNAGAIATMPSKSAG